MRTMPTDQIQYSEKYNDDKYEYRHVILPVDLAKNVPKSHLMTETEWRNLGVQQSPNWVHYMMHGPEIAVYWVRFRKMVEHDIVQHSANVGRYIVRKITCLNRSPWKNLKCKKKQKYEQRKKK
ncbi:cyclin-dependent kinases regulatory subunit 1-like isoform X1 [Belonocnema kinseyi]|uniref:cyclin-dependent kinases regulatory subunit 1-like isoform X1 n=1 Tax=Belonocnema kinseyi TaxID=2817044 RepID=UPI00143D6CD0|nr:cyclin-dependent kinases regulatory subunit 1-like isoform X1 [Belonocnema kinseyi]